MIVLIMATFQSKWWPKVGHRDIYSLKVLGGNIRENINWIHNRLYKSPEKKNYAINRANLAELGDIINFIKKMKIPLIEIKKEEFAPLKNKPMGTFPHFSLISFDYFNFGLRGSLLVCSCLVIYEIIRFSLEHVKQ